MYTISKVILNYIKKIVIEITSAKLISHILVDFTSESDMELYISKFEQIANDFYTSLKKVGLIRWRFNRVWNK